jgi:hypothetical protein
MQYKHEMLFLCHHALQLCTAGDLHLPNLPNVQYYHRLYTGYSKGWNKVRAAIDFALTKSFL